MLFEVELQVLVSAMAHRDPIGLSRIVKLPFAPFPGLTLYGLMSDPDEPVIIEEVAYSIIDQAFSCELEQDTYSSEDENEGEDEDEDQEEDEDESELTIGEKIDGYGEEWEVNEPGSDVVDKE
jgi:hypothetical protein